MERGGDLENQLERVRSEKNALLDRLRDADTRHIEELEKVVKEKNALAERLESADEKLKQYATENVTREKILQSFEDEIIRLRQTVGQTEGEKREMQERIAENEKRINFLRAFVEYYRDDIRSLWNELREERQGRNV